MPLSTARGSPTAIVLGYKAPPLRQRVDKTLFAERGNRPPHRLPRDTVLLLQVGLARNRVMRGKPTGCDFCTQNRR
jgi:hypothetical protein